MKKIIKTNVVIIENITIRFRIRNDSKIKHTWNKIFASQWNAIKINRQVNDFKKWVLQKKTFQSVQCGTFKPHSKRLKIPVCNYNEYKYFRLNFSKYSMILLLHNPSKIVFSNNLLFGPQFGYKQ